MRARARAGAIALIALLPLAACGDDDDAATTTVGAPTGDTAGAVEIEGFLFRPDALEVEAGTTVTWTNNDDFAHTVTADDDSFDSDDIGAGATFEQTFSEPGSYSYFCNIHNYMTGTVTVS